MSPSPLILLFSEYNVTNLYVLAKLQIKKHMYSFIKGNLVQANPVYVVLEASSIGYKIHIPVNVLTHLPSLGTEVMLHTSFVVREFSHTLYGFFSLQEKDIFEVLLNISGVGPKIALGLIGHLTLPGIYDAISNNDTAMMCRVPGIGKKTAERLLVEMKDKLSLFPNSFSDATTTSPAHLHSQTVRDAVSALINLGYTQAVAQKAIKKSIDGAEEDQNDVGKLIALALKNV